MSLTVKLRTIKMNPERWQKVKGLFDVVVELSPDKRERFLVKSCGGDDELRRDVENLLASSDDAEIFMEKPAASEVVSQIIEPKNLVVGTSFGHYEIVKQIGAGGMGEVYLAEDTKLDRKVAVKILNEKFAAHESNLQRFVQEARAASALNHPNILVIHEIGKSENSNYIVSEYIEGETLRDNFKQSPSKLSEVLEISIQIANALTAAHAANIVHRDIKPENIMLRPDGFVKILDFGLAKLVEQKAVGFEASTVKQNQTAKGVIMGTVNYMSPEQAKGEKIDARTDIFSFGVVLYEMIAGRTPFAGDSMSETFANLINAEPPPLARFSSNTPNELNRIVAKTLRKKRDERYQTMKDLLSDLKVLQKRLEFEEFNLSEPSAATDGLTLKTRKENLIGNVTDLKPSATADGSDLSQKSIAVLPFANISADADNEYFCDGLAEELLNALAKIKNLKVAARTSAFSFKNRNVEIGEIGKALNVKTILEGSVRKSGNKLRITAQLINAADGYQIWSKRYDGEMKDVFDLQDDITLAVIDELKVQFLSGEKTAIRNRYADNVEAYQLYLKGRFHILKLHPLEIQKGISYFQQAIKLDPNYALAYVGIANAHQILPLAIELAPDEHFPLAIAAAHKAIEIDDDLAEAHSVLGWLTFWANWDWKTAEKECRRAFEIDPNSADAYEACAHILSNTGRHSEALAAIKRAREIDPLHLRINALEGQFLLHAGKPDEALEHLQKTFALENNFWLAHAFAASVYIKKEMFAEAVSEANFARKVSGGNTFAAAFAAYALAKSGNQTEARQILDELLELSKVRNIPPYHIALIYNGLDEHEKNFEWLEKACEKRDPKMAFLKVEPKWNNLRSEPRFQDLMRRVGFSADTVNGEVKTQSIVERADTDLVMQSHTGRSFIFNDKKNKKYYLLGGVILFLLAAIGLGYYFYNSKQAVSSVNTKKSIVVLPFVNAGNDANAEYLSDGITESVINNLSQISGLKVMSRNSSFRFKDNQTNTKNIASQLGVETIVTGDIKQLGDKFIINVRLINAGDDSNIWGNQYVKTNADIIAVQNEIAQAVANNLRVKLTDSEQQKIVKNYTENPEAWQLYNRGRFYVSKSTLPELNKGIDYFNQAIEIDPNYALAYAGLAEAYRTSVLSADRLPNEVFPKAKAAAQKAIELDDSLSEAHRNLGAVEFFYDWDWKESENQYQRALELDPNNPNAHWAYAILLSNTLRHTEALAEIKRAREIDPLNLMIIMAEGVCLNAAGKPDEALAGLQKALELDPNFFATHLMMSNSYLQKGMFAEAIAEARKAKAFNGDNAIFDVNIAHALAKSGKNEEARTVLNELLKASADHYVPPSSIAAVYNVLGERDEALTLLERAVDARDVDCVFLKVAPVWNNLRNEPRFIELMRRMNF